MRREELGGCGGCEGSATRKPQVFIKSQTEVMAKKTKMGEMVGSGGHNYLFILRIIIVMPTKSVMEP